MAVHDSKPGTHSGNETRRASGTPAPTYRGAKVSVADLPQHTRGNEVCGIGGAWETSGGGTPSRDKIGQNKATDKNMGLAPHHRAQR